MHREVTYSEKLVMEDALDTNWDLHELHNQLNNAVVDENYELAAKIRDEISKRS